MTFYKKKMLINTWPDSLLIKKAGKVSLVARKSGLAVIAQPDEYPA